MSVYDFEAVDVDGKLVKLSEYKGKVLLIFNSATKCGFTPQYEALQALYDKYEKDGLVLLDFPCNQFGGQAPGTDEEIVNFCTSAFGITFPVFSKIEVNGDNAHPLFRYLVGQKGFAGFDQEHASTKRFEEKFSQLDPDYASKPDIKWNFTKFLISRDGAVQERFEPTAAMERVEQRITELL